MNDAPNAPCAVCGAPLPEKSRMNVCGACAFEAAQQPEPMPEPEPLPPVEGFEIHELAGEGGMGRVYRASQRVAGRIVALKVMRNGLSPRAEQRFLEEVRLLSLLDHPNVATLHTAGLLEDGGHYMAMGWIEGAPLHDWLAAERPPAREVVRVVREAALGVQAAHALPVVHRDLKPGNILVGDGGKLVKVVDFGVAQDIRETRDGAGRPLTQDGTVTGTVAFLSPEQARSRRAGPASDVFSLGIILFQCLTDRHPFLKPEDTGLYGQLRTMGEGRAAVFPKDGRALPGDLRAVILKALEPDPERRYGTAGELAADLTAWLENRPVRARAPGALYAARKWIRRHPWGTAAAAAALLTAAGSGAWHLSTREKAARELAAQLVETRLTAAELAGQRGQWAGALRLLDQAGRADARDTRRVILARVEALVSTGGREQAAALLAGLPPGPSGDPGRAGLPDFWRAQLCSGVTGIPQADALLRQAAGAGLPPAEDLIARAFLAEDAAEALLLLERVVREYPMNHQGLALCSLAQLFAGHPEEARGNLDAAVRLFPDSADLPQYRLLIEAAAGAGTAGNDPRTRALAEILQAGSRIYDLAWGRAKGSLPLLALGGLLVQNYDSVSSVALKLTWSMRSREVREVLNILSPFSGTASRVRGMEALMAEPHPPPMLLMVYSVVLTEEALTDTVMLARLEKACRLCRESPMGNRQCLALTLETTGGALLFHAVHGTAPGARERALELVRERLEITEVPPVAAVAEAISGGCLQLGEPGMAKTFAEAALREKPGQGLSIWCLARAEMELGRWQRCLELLDSLPSDSDYDPQKVAGVRETASRGLREYLKKHGTPPEEAGTAAETPAPSRAPLQAPPPGVEAPAVVPVR